MASLATFFVLFFSAFFGNIICQGIDPRLRNPALTTIPESIKTCYRNTMFYPSNRLSNSLDNLIYLIEKIEDAFIASNYPADAAKMANLLLKRFQVNGIKDVQNYDDKTRYDYEINKQDIVWSLFPNSSLDYNQQFPAEGVLSDKEKCSLHWMLSTTINTSANYDYYSYSYNTDPSLYYPREGGTLYSDRAGTFSGGNVLSGIAASPVAYTIMVKDLLDAKQLSGIDSGLQSMQIDPILGATLSGEIAQSVILYAYPPNVHPILGPDGTWNGTNCATSFTLNTNISTAATDSELAGAIDGLTIGYYLKRNFYQSGVATAPLLSQVLRSYYGRGLQPNSYNVCTRKSTVGGILNQVTDSATAFAVVYKAKGSIIDVNHAYPLYTTIGADISNAVSLFSSTYLQSSAEMECNQEIQTLPCQSENDIFVVMDVSVMNSYDNFQQQKNFVGTLINRITSFPNGSHFGIYTFASSSREPVPLSYNPYLSGADIRCQLQQYNLYTGTTDAPGTVRFIQEKVRSLRNYQRNANLPKLPGKVVIFIYLQTSLSSRDETKTAMGNLRAEFPELTVLAVGSNRDVLQNFANSNGDIFVSPGEQLSYNVEPIRKRLCTAPATIEYRDCRNPNVNTERNLITDTFVYQDTYQWFAIYPWTMNRSTDLYLNFNTLYGGARICVRRSISYDAPPDTCFETSTSDPNYRFDVGDTCGNSCPPVYINVKGRTSSGSEQKCSERACDSWNQAKISIVHDGLKCSACQVLSTIAILLIGVLCSFLRQL